MFICFRMKLIDNYGRIVNGLRISVTQECNLNCIYCHREGIRESNGIMSADRICAIVREGSKFGINKIKITGGEPLIRRDITDIISMISDIDGIEDLSMTTNGIFLEKHGYELKEAGLNRVNISLDTLDKEIYSKITKSNPSNIEKVKNGLGIAIDSGLYPVKLNMVILKNLNDHSVQEMINFARERKVMLQLIELINRNSDLYVDLSKIENELRRNATKIIEREMHKRKKYFVGTEVEVVRPHNPEFCMNCSRLRVTSDSRFKICLLRNEYINIDKDIGNSFIEAVRRRRPFIR